MDVMDFMPRSIPVVSTLGIPTLLKKGVRARNGKTIDLYEVRMPGGNSYKSLRSYCQLQGIPYQSVRKDLNIYSWEVVHDKYIAKRRRRQDREIEKARRLPPDARPDLGPGLFKAALETANLMHMAESPLGRLPRKTKIAMLQVLHATCKHYTHTHHDPDTRRNAMAVLSKEIRGFEHELETIARRAEVAKRLKVGGYDASA